MATKLNSGKAALHTYNDFVKTRNASEFHEPDKYNNHCEKMPLVFNAELRAESITLAHKVITQYELLINQLEQNSKQRPIYLARINDCKQYCETHE